MWKMASQALMWERKALPSPCPEWAPFTRPAMSTTFRKAGTLLESQTRRRWDRNAGNAGQLTQTDRTEKWVRCTHLAGLWYWQRKSKRSSGTGTLLSFGSIVQNGKFSAAAWLLVSTLKNVDFLWWFKAREGHVNSCWVTQNTQRVPPSTNYASSTYPTLGNPTIPILREVPNRPINVGCFGASAFLGAICVN